MSNIHYDIDCDFTQIPNHIILNPNISGTAKAIYFYIIMRLRQNAEWEFYDFDIMNHLKEGRDSFRNAKKELIEYGYLVKLKQNIGDDGKYKGCDYAIKKEPITENPTSEKPKSAKPTSENPYTNNKEQSNNINKKQSNKEKDTASGLSVKNSNFSEKSKNSTNTSHSKEKNNQKIKKEEIEDFIRSYTYPAKNQFEACDENGNIVNPPYFNDTEQKAILQYILDRKGCKATERALKLILTACRELKDDLKTKNVSLETIFEKNADGFYVYISRADGTPFQNLLTNKEVIIKKVTNNKQYDTRDTEYELTKKAYEYRLQLIRDAQADISDRFGFDES